MGFTAGGYDREGGGGYGILHDQVTARSCLEYFTVAHPPVFPTRSPTLLALGWGDCGSDR